MMKNMRLSYKIGLGYSIILTLVFGAVIGTGFSSYTITQDITTAKDYNLSVAQAGQKVKVDILNVWQWLTDISATRAMDGLDDGFKEAEKSAQSLHKGIAFLKKAHSDHGHSAHVKEMENLSTRFDAIYETGKSMARAYVDGGPAAGNKLMGAAVKVNRFITLVCLVLLCGCKSTQSPGNNQEWISLFNGKDLEGWTAKFTGYELGDNVKLI